MLKYLHIFEFYNFWNKISVRLISEKRVTVTHVGSGNRLRIWNQKPSSHSKDVHGCNEGLNKKICRCIGIVGTRSVRKSTKCP